MIKVLVEIGMPEPDAASCAAPQAAPQQTIEERVRNALDLIESGYCSHTEWLMINRLYKGLQERKGNPRAEALMRMIEPTLAKYGYHKVTTNR